MKRRNVINTAIVLFVSSVALGGGARPNFSGTWVMDPSRSIGIPPDLQQTITVTQTGDQVKVEIKIASSQGERSFPDIYTLDGKEVEFTPQGMAGPAPGKGKRKSSWLPNDRGILVSEETTTDSPNGPVVNQQSRKWTMSADGSTLIADYYFDGPRGSFETKRVYVKRN
jgi:hypothetical protein